MYKMIVQMLEDGMTVHQIAAELDIAVRQVKEIEDDFYQFV